MNECTGKIETINNIQIIHCDIHNLTHIYPYPNIKRYYETDQFYLSYSPVDWYSKEVLENADKLWHTYYEFLISICRSPSFYSDILLDLGCGFGWFLQYYDDNNLGLCYGVEPSEYARNRIPNHIEVKKNLDDFHPDMWFDLISVQLTLEHIPYPDEWLREKVLPRLHNDGRLLITVPNDFNPLQRKIGYDGFINKVHVNYFTPRSLRSMLNKLGLEVVYESASFPMELFVLMGLNYIGNDELGRKCHQIRLRFEKLFGVRTYRYIYKYLYDKWEIGRELIFVAKKRKVKVAI